MNILGISVIGLGTGGIIAALTLVFTWFTNKDDEKEYGEHIGKQKAKSKEIKSKSKAQNEVKADINKTEDVAKQKEQEIQDIVNETSKKVDEVMNSDKGLSQTQDNIEEKWNDL